MNILVRTLSGRTVTMEVDPSDTLALILDKICNTEGISPKNILFSAEQQPGDELEFVSTPDLFDSEEMTERNSDPLWTPGSIKASQEQPTIDDDKLFIVTFEALKTLFCKCHEPGCGAKVEERDLHILVKGAGLKISALCTKNHLTRWESAEFFNNVSVILTLLSERKCRFVVFKSLKYLIITVKCFRLLHLFYAKVYPCDIYYQCCGSGSGRKLFASRIRILIRNYFGSGFESGSKLISVSY
jgi:hypothetical protein